MDTLFSAQERRKRTENAPLAARMRPRTLEGFVGQAEAVGPGSWLRTAIEHDTLSSVILYGPAGTGKTTLARIIANVTQAEFVEVSAITGTVKDLRREVEAAEQRLYRSGRRTILFVDEIHRFNRSQQDALLHAVEDRVVVLVGATTENPYFEVNSALLSRSRVVELTALDDASVGELLDRALASADGLNGAFSLDEGARARIVSLAGGDGRAALTTLELSAQLATPDGRLPQGPGDEGPRPITLQQVEEANPRRGLPYDKGGDLHYDIVSAFIKSMRGSDPDAALYWLARMIDGGEDPRFIARRIMICASEDIGNADPQALLVAEAAFKAAEVIGYPECRINLAQAAIYLALAPKSNAAEAGIDAALHEVRTGPRREVPSYLRDRHRPGSEGYGPYLYPHAYPGGWVEQRYLPEGLERGAFYAPSGRGWEGWRLEATARDRAGGES
ncbi:replication-associated recombination protein A [Olsenella sp. YH-ols2217]|uniref:Replication-associated recombination protein A n=1 Tax=Kribbibacterium absianum TaxID=3044210 RepID=A0ABT6ZM71_9ACTN|nr:MULTISPECIES: replication-associated recombination protein A [unclassified Olsenella]MDJ1122127.1 replication-associated recombination protein A [Olsenella sp. YH-ols2216]MDJ1130135.1 replication-associated recombination protein A [Olsenella sp. YH-ols2217]